MFIAVFLKMRLIRFWENRRDALLKPLQRKKKKAKARASLIPSSGWASITALRNQSQGYLKP
jgi:hypothetical protein